MPKKPGKTNRVLCEHGFVDWCPQGCFDTEEEIKLFENLSVLMESQKSTYKCPDCGEDIEIEQPKEHSEYAPGGTCKNCRGVFIMIKYREGNKTLYKVGISEME